MADESTGKPAAEASSDPKARFREALDRKRSQQAERAAADARGESKIHGAHAAEGGKRTFRRKSG